MATNSALIGIMSDRMVKMIKVYNLGINTYSSDQIVALASINTLQ